MPDAVNVLEGVVRILVDIDLELVGGLVVWVITAVKPIVSALVGLGAVRKYAELCGVKLP